MRETSVIISGGGTGGHLYPALAVGKKLTETVPDIRLIFVGGRRSVEKTIMDHFQADFVSLNIEGLKGKGWRAIRSLTLLPLAFVKSLSLLLRIRPELVIGVGGYSSGPVVLLAAWMRIPTLILEQNIRPGFTNRKLLPWIRKAVVSFESSLPYFRGKGIFLGNPVRGEFYSLTPKERNSKLSLLIFGGSQGSHFLNKEVIDSLSHLESRKNEIRVFHQTGEKDWEWIKNRYAESGFSDIEVKPYFHNMYEYFQKADLVISRAGATSIAELIAAQKAAILVPFANAADNHQVLNARELEKARAAEVIEEKEFNSKVFAEKILYFLNNKKRINQMEQNLKPLRTENVAEKIIEICTEMMHRKERSR